MDEFTQELASVPMVKHAQAYAKKGWRVFPLWWPEYPLVCACPKKEECHSPGKHPLTKNGVKDSTLRPNWIAKWWERWPYANIGLACGQRSGFIVLDVDGNIGRETITQLTKKHGIPDPTLSSITGSGGRHVLWRYSVGIKNRINFQPKLDVRSDDGHIVAPPSMHESGERYRWHERGHPKNVRLQPAPPWMLELMRAPPRRTARNNGYQFDPDRPKPEVDLDTMDPFGKGERNEGLFKLAGRVAWEETRDVYDTIHEANLKLCKPPLGKAEVDKLIASALRY